MNLLWGSQSCLNYFEHVVLPLKASLLCKINPLTKNINNMLRSSKNLIPKTKLPYSNPFFQKLKSLISLLYFNGPS